MKENIQRYSRIVKLLVIFIGLTMKEYLESKRWYRQLFNTTWYYVCAFDTGEEYWTKVKPESWEAMIIDIEKK